MVISVLGSPYSIEYKNEADDAALKGRDGYCDTSVRRIVVDTMAERDRYSKGDMMAYRRAVVRHEIIHAMLYEGGLDTGWAHNEEIVDWIAIQGPKLYKAWVEAGAMGGDTQCQQEAT